MLSNDVFSFFRSWTCDPLRVGAVTPSGRALAEVITSEISPGCAPIIDLGPGTGVFTRARLARDVRETDLTLIESGGDFAALLHDRFPKASVLRMDAAHLKPTDLHGQFAGAVVSGLPLLAMSPRKVL